MIKISRKRINISCGDAYVREILESPNTERFQRIARMTKDVVVALCADLRNHNLLADSRKGVSVERQVLQFLYICTGSTFYSVKETFKCSTETVSRYFHQVLNAIHNFSKRTITRPNPNVVPSEILNNPKFSPSFDKVLGAMDGILIPIWVPAEKVSPFRDRKGGVSQNVLFMCSFDMKFTAVFPGSEGCASDLEVFNYLDLKGGIRIPDGKCVIADAGYALSPTVLTPFRGTRYQFPSGSDKPQDMYELFNLRHSQLRNVIERTFGVLQKRFPILKKATEGFTIMTQVKLVIALCGLDNFIVINGGMNDDIGRKSEEEMSRNFDIENGTENEEDDPFDDDEPIDGDEWRLVIATDMWNDYNREEQNKKYI